MYRHILRVTWERSFINLFQFRSLQEKALKDYAERLTSPSVGENVLTTFLQARNIRDVCQSFNILEQSWWLKLLILSYMLVTNCISRRLSI